MQEAAEDSKNLDTFDSSVPITSSSLAELSAASASMEMAAAAAARKSFKTVPTPAPATLTILSSGVEAGLSPQDDVSLADLGRAHAAGAHMAGFGQGMPQHPAQGAQQRQQQQLQQQQLFNLKMLETSMENLPEQLDFEKYAPPFGLRCYCAVH